MFFDQFSFVRNISCPVSGSYQLVRKKGFQNDSILNNTNSMIKFNLHSEENGCLFGIDGEISLLRWRKQSKTLNYIIFCFTLLLINFRALSKLIKHLEAHNEDCKYVKIQFF